MEEDTGKSLHVGGATGRIHGADHSLVDYNRAGIPLIEIVTKPIIGTGEKAPAVARPTSPSCATCSLGARRLRRPDGAGLAALRRQPLAGPDGRRQARHPHRDQERQLAALGRAGGPLRDAAARRRSSTRAARSCRRPGTGTRTPGSPPAAGRSPTPRTTATSPSPTWCRSRPPASGSTSCAPRCRSRRASGGPGCRPSGASPTSRCATPSAPARSAWSRRPSPPAPRPQAARKWWLGELARRANDTASSSADLGVTPADVAAGAGAGRRGHAQRQAGPPGLRRPARRRGHARRDRRRPRPGDRLRRRRALGAAVDTAIAANPDVADKIRDGKVAAAGALIGAVMKEMRGQADAGRVRELILEKLT